MSDINSKFNELNNGKYPFVKFPSVKIEAKTSKTIITLHYDKDRTEEYLSAKNDIYSTITQLLPVYSKRVIEEISIGSKADDLKKGIFKYLQLTSPFLMFSITADMISISIPDDAIITLNLPESIYKYCTQFDIVKPLTEYLNNNFFVRCSVSILSFEESNDLIKQTLQVTHHTVEYAQGKSSNDRRVKPTCREKFIGDIINEDAKYICDCKSAEKFIVVCGYISSYNIYEKNKDDGTIKKYSVFELTDPTGSLKCLFFPRKNEEGRLKWLFDNPDRYVPKEKPVLPEEEEDNIDGEQVYVDESGYVESTEMPRKLPEYKETGDSFIDNNFGKTFVIVKGNVNVDERANNGSVFMFVSKISFADMQENFKVIDLERLPNLDYYYVQPVKKKFMQDSTFVDLMGGDVVSKNRKQITNVIVFEFKTNTIKGKAGIPIELGAVKIVDRNIVSTFHSLIYPEAPLSKEFISVKNITEKDYLCAPKFDKVISDFNLYAQDSVLTAMPYIANESLLKEYYLRMHYPVAVCAEYANFVDKEFHYMSKEALNAVEYAEFSANYILNNT